ncbi:hypothetical protein AB0I60_21620 [Actinosynnema sp. NPDC050436]|uniref:hypothetical protein n=1 Tax=Actinosynnema sp. NPDC050436 TaxID=3155659 RepID=UPI0033C0D3A2
MDLDVRVAGGVSRGDGDAAADEVGGVEGPSAAFPAFLLVVGKGCRIFSRTSRTTSTAVWRSSGRARASWRSKRSSR